MRRRVTSTPNVTAERIDEPGNDKALIRIKVDPGPQARVKAVDVSATGEVKSRAEAGDAAAASELARLKNDWSLKPGDVFSQSAWAGAKSSALASMRANGYANADWLETRADVNAPANTASLFATADSGPLYLLGPLNITGLERYDESVVKNLSDYRVGEPYSEKKILDFQERLRKVDLFEGAAVEIEPEVKTAKARARECARARIAVAASHIWCRIQRQHRPEVFG